MSKMMGDMSGMMKQMSERMGRGMKKRSRTRFMKNKEGIMKPIWQRLVLVTGWLAPSGILAQERFYEWRWEMHPMWWGWGLGMMAMMFLFWALVIVGLVVGIRWFVGQGKEEKSDSTIEILRQRYARGEINKDEFEAKKKDLRG